MNNHQQGPPEALEALRGVVADVSYKDNWRLWLADMMRGSEHYAGSSGLTLCIGAEVPNSTAPGETTHVEHWMAPPPASWDRQTWIRWVFDQLLLVERHEAMEFYAIAGRKVFFPSHGPGRDPYSIEGSWA